LSISAALCLLPTGVAAQAKLGPVEFHGYGDVTTHSGDSADESWDTHHDFSLVATTALGEKAKLWVQGAYLSHVGLRLDWAFLDWSLTPTTTLRIGQIRLPFGLDNELRDVQALRPSASLPQVYEDEVGIIDESLRGLAVEHRATTAAGSELTTEVFFAAAMVPDTETAETGHVVGTRVVWSPAESRWSYRVSGYAGQIRPDTAAPGSALQNKDALAVSVQRTWNVWKLSAEVAHARISDKTYLPVYVQLEQSWGSRWSGFARVEQLRATQQNSSTRQQILGGGVAWKPSLHWGARAELLANKLSADVVPSTARTSWLDAHLSVNFMF
jgi:hypothetical protein